MVDILQVLKERYGPVVQLNGGFTNAAFLLETNPLQVAKVARLSDMDLENEAAALRFVEDKSIAPRFMQMLLEGSSFALLTTFENGTNGQAILDTGDMEKATKLFYQMGIHLAKDIHSYQYQNDKSTSIRVGQLLRNEVSFVPHELILKTQSYFKLIDLNQSEWVLTHGDYGSHNILFSDNDGFTVIDWEWAEWFHPLVDIAWACWNTKLHYPKMAAGLNQAFINAYQSVRPIHITNEDIKAYVIYKLWSILGRLNNQDQETQTKWMNRLRWTFENQVL